MSKLDVLRLCAKTCSAYFAIVSSSCVCRPSHSLPIHADKHALCDRRLVYKTRVQGPDSPTAAPGSFPTGEWVSAPDVELLRGSRVEAHLKWIDAEHGPLYIYFDTRGGMHGSGVNRKIGANAALLIPSISTSYDITRARSVPVGNLTAHTRARNFNRNTAAPMPHVGMPRSTP